MDFSLVSLPENLQNLDPNFYHQGILFTSPIKKGKFLVELLKSRDYFPKKIVVIDDKLANLESLEKELSNLGIDFVGYWYHRADLRHRDFDSLVSTIELEALLNNEVIIDEEFAIQMASKLRESGVDPDSFFFHLIDKLDFDAMLKQYRGK